MGVKTMESAQLILAYLFNLVWYGFSTLFIFDFLWGLSLLVQETFETPTVSPAQPVNQQLTFPDLNQSLGKYSDTIRPYTNEDEATIQYLEMVGADIDDFESIAEARRFLNQHAPWTIETPQVKSQSLLPDPWIEPFEDLSPIFKELKVQVTAPKSSKVVKKSRKNKRRWLSCGLV
jgi:hypothetical protein